MLELSITLRTSNLSSAKPFCAQLANRMGKSLACKLRRIVNVEDNATIISQIGSVITESIILCDAQFELPIDCAYTKKPFFRLCQRPVATVLR